MNILDEIFAHKKAGLAQQKKILPLADLRQAAKASPQPPAFIQALQASHKGTSEPALIAEVKFASPSRGVLVHHPDPLGLAGQYICSGAVAISVLTEEKYFHGRLQYLEEIHRRFPAMPLLRKDFLCDPYQLYEARVAGASAALLIAAALDPALLADLHALAAELALAALVEVHDLAELETALSLPGLALIGVNNRDLRTFRVDLQTCLDLRGLVPASVCYVAESGIQTREDVRRLSAAGVEAILVGESLVTAPDVPQAVRDLIGKGAPCT
jgi:indole-3-glycerol phosphate synthase